MTKDEQIAECEHELKRIDFELSLYQINVNALKEQQDKITDSLIRLIEDSNDSGTSS